MTQGNETPRAAGLAATIWPLVTGLAVGFLVGRETAGPRSGAVATEAAAAKSDDQVPAGTKLPAKIYKAESEFPEGWTKSADLASVTTVSMTDLTTAQKTTVMQAL